MSFHRILTYQRLTNWGLVFLVFTLMALMNYTRFVTSELAEGQPGKYVFYFIMETTGSYMVLLLLPLMLWFFRKAPITRSNLHTAAPLHLLATLVFGVCHTMLMYGSRVLIFRLADMGSYNYGRLGYRFVMEYTHQFFAYWSILGAVLFIKSVRERQEQELRAARLEQQLTRVRLQALQMQLNPHFLFNTLNLISSAIYDNPQAADKMIATLSDLLRHTLASAVRDEHPFRQELELIRLYLEIMQARFEDKLIVRMDVDEDTLNALTPRFILQPLMENSIKYGMENPGHTEIIVQSRRVNDRMVLSITDNGPGFPEDPETTMRAGIGLSSTLERLEKLYGADYRFHLQNLDHGGGQVVMDIPFRVAEEEAQKDPPAAKGTGLMKKALS